MKNSKFYFLILSIFFACAILSCGGNDATSTNKPKTNISKEPSKKANSKQNHSSETNNNQGDYYSNLQKSLKLKKSQIRETRAIEAKFTQQLRATRSSGKLTKEERKKITTQKEEAIKKYLGPVLYKKKVNFDRRNRK